MRPAGGRELAMSEAVSLPLPDEVATEAAAAAELDATVSFPEVVWAHFERQRELESGQLKGPAECEYRRRLRVFKQEYGEIVSAYWCRFEPSGVAVTAKEKKRSLWRPWLKETERL